MFKGVGRHPKTGKKKGGIKVHSVVYANEGVPYDVQIANLLMALLQKRLTRSWSFSGLDTMVRIVRIVLMYYINIDAFFEKPDEDLKRLLLETTEPTPTIDIN